MKGTETIVRLRGGTQDRNGDPGDAPGEKTFKGCIVYPRGTPEEQLGAQDTTVITKTVYVPPPNADIVSTDEIRYGGKVWAIDGQSADYTKGAQKGVFVNIKRAVG